MSESLHILCDRWLGNTGPQSDIVVSSRARLARNLAGARFARSSTPEDLKRVHDAVAAAISAEPIFSEFHEIVLADLSAAERSILREAHLISPELERHTKHCAVHLAPDASISVMVNEEDHIRMQAIVTGYRVREAHRVINEVDDTLTRHLQFAFSSRLGYLTACPTNTGTGLRASVMLHLPGLVMNGDVEKIIREIAEHGFAVRGLYGEGSNCTGDLYQISNEVTLGKSEEEIIESLLGVLDQLIVRERDARQSLFNEKPVFVEDAIWRSYGTLVQARMINSAEAIGLLSRLRLGIERGHFHDRLTHHDLNRLLIEIQPGHLMAMRKVAEETELRDAARADFLRERLIDIANSN
jgi:protein arginine kinase